MDRLFAITLLLQARKKLRAQDLAEKFEVNERTIYRDMAALSESGVPIIGTPGEGYALVEGYYLPPLLFTQSEAAALFLSAHMLMANATGRVPQDARGAIDKISVVLPKHLRAEIDRMREIIHFAGSMRPFNFEEPHLMQLQQAIRERRVVGIRYQSFRGGSGESAVTEREIEPYGLGFAWGAWYVHAWCRLRNDMREFRLERIDALTLTHKTFEIRQTEPAPRPTQMVRIRFAPQVVRWVRERQHYGYRGDDGDDEETEDGLIMRYEIEALDELKAWLLGWGADAEPLEPPALRTMIRDEVTKMARAL
jgi:predicted DNA-binding transcriptional regulator YafY